MGVVVVVVVVVVEVLTVLQCVLVSESHHKETSAPYL